MDMNSGLVEEFSFSSDDNIATACSGALRKARNLADAAPIGRLFSSISTLADVSNNINTLLNAGDLSSAAKQMKKYATPVITDSEPLPMHFKRRG
jgi:hypothetical protein